MALFQFVKPHFVKIWSLIEHSNILQQNNKIDWTSGII